MIIRTATKKDAKAFNDLASYCFGDPYEEHALYDEIFDYENTKVVEQDGKLVGGYTLFPFEMNYGAELAKMGGLSCVVMDVDARYSGFAKTMLTEMLSDMKERGFVFCALGAFNIEFYRKLGWEASYDRTHYEIDINVFKPYLTSEYKIEKHYGVPIDEIIPVQTEYAKRYIGYIPRTKKYWQMFDNLIKEAKNLCATVKMDEKTAGYIIYKLHDKKVDVREIVYTSSASLQALFGFIYRHNSQCSKVLMEVPCDFPLRLLSDDLYKVDCKIKTFMMNRVVNVKKAFELGDYPNIGEYTIALKIDDPKAQWNDGVWHLFLSQGNISAEKGSGDENYGASISIQNLSRMIIGYVSGETLLELGMIEANTEEAADFIKSVFLKKETFINNRF